MALTSNGDIEQLKKQVAVLKEHIKVLAEQVFKDVDLLLEKDDSWDIVRQKRDYILRTTDWVMTPGSTVDQSAWASYRQMLRDLPQRFKGCSADKVVWPKAPSIAGPNTLQ